MLKRYFILGIIIFVGGMCADVGYKWIHKFRVSSAFNEYQGAILESKKFRARYRAELERILTMTERGMNPFEQERVTKRLSELKEEIKKATERLAIARKKFCDLVGDEELFCQEEQSPAPQGWPI
ncbi:hypothetical protein A2661_02265 [Candidatus Giovannonibacteria bacterium RIFCSPHIGHO2_01_FULL_45_24]|uniref:DUF5667 domain-containing protein n=1 Tax=Candidatus Giovannonibacteria bacterium RIFCSPLOWO2_01_FULL_46_32 TaxID=1798353 RepID=A0A1F5XJ84_9BACT|nr:MAG: hypothetical protein A2661_02265 [Candidatus Giovannonibacteria bacterium RIFCSPHIGHO2_01_FULL_45_24]OGF87521.1 MAG: hypothetical protein A3B19_02990 [Candidatus Giovannonibacteria bacterium RIFCSPLOWO2_01_FULL_46_32]